MDSNFLSLMQAMQTQAPQNQANQLNKSLGEYSPLESAALFSSLLLDSNFQSNAVTLEKAVYLCLSECTGKRIPTKRYIKNIFESIHSSGLGMMEDPAEDVAASLLWFFGKSYKVLLGGWEGCIQQTQAFLNATEQAAKKNGCAELCNTIHAQLIASDTVLSRFNVPINAVTADYPLKALKSRDIQEINVVLELLDVTSLEQSEKLPLCPQSKWPGLSSAVPGNTALEGAPFVSISNRRYLILPTAITLSIRRAIFSFFVESEMQDAFKRELLKSYTNMLKQISIFGETDLKNIPIHFQKIPNQKDFLFAQSSIEFDSGYHYLFLFLSDALEGFENNWFQETLYCEKDINDFLAERIEVFYQSISKGNPDAKFCTFIVPCGYGRGLGVAWDFKKKDWLIESVPFHDLITLSQDSDCNAYRMWRLVEAVDILRKYEGRIHNVNGLLNLYGYVKENDFSILNHSGSIDMEANSLQIFVGTNFQKTIRESVLQDEDIKIVKHLEYGYITVKRGYPHSLFNQNDMRDIYCPLNMKRDLLQIVICNKGIELWIEQDVTERVEMALQVQLFQAYIKWASKVVKALLSLNVIFDHIKVIRLEIEYPNDHGKPCLKVKGESVLNSSSFELDDGILECSYNESLYHGFHLSENISEKSLLRPFILKACKGNEKLFNDISQMVFKNKYARYAHFFQSNSYSENIIGSFEHETPITLEVAADNNTKFGLGWIDGNRPKHNIIEGKNNCTQYLAQVVGTTWEKLRNKLKVINKPQLLELLFRNIELCDLHRNRWARTFKANLNLIDDKENLYQVASKEVGLLNGASIASRLLIEMALCESPAREGRKAGRMDVQELQSYAMTMHVLGGVSDAINYDAIKPKIFISLFGDLIYDHDFEDLIVERYQYGLQETKFNSAVRKHKELFNVERQYVASKEEVESGFDKQFWAAWIQEFGFDINEGIDFINVIQSYGYDQEKLVFKLDRQDLYGVFSDWEKSTVDAVIDCLTLSSRKIWTKIPKPYKSSDWQPWRYKRRYSMAFKPLVYLKEEEVFIISPQHLLRGYFHLLRNAFEATIDENHFHSKKMIVWNGTKKAKEGLVFNSEVAALFDQGDWVVEEEVKLTKILNKKLKDFGDVDVLAWHKTKNIVLAIECKDLEVAKTQGEIARQLAEFKGKVNSKGKGDRLHKHIIRLDELNNNIAGVAAYCGNKNAEETKVIGMVVFSFIVPMNFAEIDTQEIIFSDVNSLMDEVNLLCS